MSKRVASFTEELERLDLERSRVRAKLDSYNYKLATNQKNKSVKAHGSFIRKLQRKKKIPLIRKAPFVAPIVLHIDIEDDAAMEVEKAKEYSLLDCLYLPELAAQILVYLGPVELYLSTLVSRDFEKYTSKAFMQLAPLFLDQYGENLLIHVKEDFSLATDKVVYEKNVIKLKEFIKVQKEISKPVSIHDMLHLWHNMFVTSRKYDISSCSESYGKRVYVLNSTFSDHSGTYLPLTQQNLYKMTKYKQACEILDKKWEKKKRYPFDVSDDEKLYHFRREELQVLNLIPITSHFTMSKDIVMIKGDKLVRLKDSGHTLYPINFPDAERASTASLVALSQKCFFDYSEIKVAFNKWWQNTKKKVYTESVAEHADRLLYVTILQNALEIVKNQATESS